MSEQTESIVPADYLHDDVQAVAEYRSVSGLAVLAAVLGVCSLLALVDRGLLVVPLLGVVCGLLALRRIAASEGQLAGRAVAMVGLALSLVIGTGVYVRGLTLERLVAAEAQQWALQWCDLIRDGQTLTALELKNPPEARRPFDDSLAEYYETNDAAIEAYQLFREHPVIEAIAAAPKGAKVVPGKVLGVVPNGRGGYTAAQQFELVPPGGDSTGPRVKFNLQLSRAPVRSAGGGAWNLTDHLMADE